MLQVMRILLLISMRLLLKTGSRPHFQSATSTVVSTLLLLLSIAKGQLNPDSRIFNPCDLLDEVDLPESFAVDAYVFCDPPNEPIINVFFSDGDESATALLVRVEDCTTFPARLFVGDTKLHDAYVSRLPTAVYVVNSDKHIETILDGAFDGLTHVQSLHLSGFTKLRHLDSNIFSPLQSIRKLVLVEFGADFLKYGQLGSAFRELSGTPLDTVVLDGIHSIDNTERFVNLSELVTAVNVPVRKLAFTNNVIIGVDGRLSKLLPNLTQFCGSGDVIAEVVAYAKFHTDLMLFHRNIVELMFFGDSRQPSPRDPGQGKEIKSYYSIRDVLMEIWKDLSFKEKYRLQQCINGTCYAGFELPFPPTLKTLVYHGLIMPDINTSEPICVHPKNNIIYLDFSWVRLPSHVPLVEGLHQLKYLILRHTRVNSLHEDALKYLPKLEVLDFSYSIGLNSFISGISRRFFGNAPALRNVCFSNCRLTKFPSDALADVTSLERLDLSRNDLDSFEVDLSNCSRLSVVDLSLNRLRSLPKSVIAQLNDIGRRWRRPELPPSPGSPDTSAIFRLPTLTINLTGNPLDCGCEDDFFIEWLQRSRNGPRAKIERDAVATSEKTVIHVIEAEQFNCHYDYNLTVRLIDVNVTDLKARCRVLNKIKSLNNTSCPCDYGPQSDVDALKRVRFLMTDYYCFDANNQLVSLADLPTLCQPLPVISIALSSTVAALVLIFFVIVFLLYRFRGNPNVRAIVDCLPLTQLLNFAIEWRRREAASEPLLQEELQQQLQFAVDVFVYVHHDEDPSVPRAIAEKLTGMAAFTREVSIVTQDSFIPGRYVLDSLVECLRNSRIIVPVLTPNFTSDSVYLDFISRALLDRPDSLVPVVWSPIDEVGGHEAISHMLQIARPVRWPGGGVGGSVDSDDFTEYERQDFWNELYARTLM